MTHTEERPGHPVKLHQYCSGNANNVIQRHIRVSSLILIVLKYLTDLRISLMAIVSFAVHTTSTTSTAIRTRTKTTSSRRMSLKPLPLPLLFASPSQIMLAAAAAARCSTARPPLATSSLLPSAPDLTRSRSTENRLRVSQA